MIEHRGKRRLDKESDTRLHVGLREQPNRAKVQNDTTAQRERNQLDEDERSDLANAETKNQSARLKS
jgi:hypothetical protein